MSFLTTCSNTTSSSSRYNVVLNPARGETSENTIGEKACSNDNGKVECEHPICTAPSCPIPFPHYHIKRTESETRLCEQMEVAEMRDRVMFCRIQKGMKRTSDKPNDSMHYPHFDRMQTTTKLSQVRIPQFNDTSSSDVNDPTTLEVSDKEETSKARAKCTLSSCDCIFHLEM